MRLLRRKTKSFEIQVQDLVLRITADDDFRMPPVEAGEPTTAFEVRRVEPFREASASGGSCVEPSEERRSANSASGVPAATRLAMISSAPFSPASGVRISWASPAAISPSTDSRSARRRCSCDSRKSPSAVSSDSAARR